MYFIMHQKEAHRHIHLYTSNLKNNNTLIYMTALSLTKISKLVYQIFEFKTFTGCRLFSSCL